MHVYILTVVLYLSYVPTYIIIGCIPNYVVHRVCISQVGKVVYELKAIDLDDDPILRFKIDGNLSEARNEDGAVVKLVEYDFISTFDLNHVDGTLRVGHLIDREKVEIIKIVFIVEDEAAAKHKQVSSGMCAYVPPIYSYLLTFAFRADYHRAALISKFSFKHRFFF